MSNNFIIKNFSIIKGSNKASIKPRNELRINTFSFNDIYYFTNTKKVDIYKLKRMKPEYKQLYRDLIHNKINSEYESVDKKIPKPKNNNVLNYKLNSFLDGSSMNKDSQILIRLNNLKSKLLRNKNQSYFSDNKNTNSKNMDNQVLKSLENNCFLTYKRFNKNSRNKFSKNINIKNNYINNTNNNNIKLIINKYQNIENENKFDADEIEKENDNKNDIINNNEITKDKKEKKLISENSKLKKELEYSNNQLEKYKKYQALYLNLLKKVKSHKNLINNINLNNNNNIKEQYLNDLIERRNEINCMLKEDDILENNLKDILYKLE